MLEIIKELIPAFIIFAILISVLYWLIELTPNISPVTEYQLFGEGADGFEQRKMGMTDDQYDEYKKGNKVVMKQTKFEKQLVVKNQQGIVNGKILVNMDYSTKTITGTHPSTHDDYTRTISIHKITAYVDDTEFKSMKELTSEQEVLSKVVEIEKETLEYMLGLIKNEPTPTIVNKFNDLGFKEA